jgi:hypothetical protein
MPAGCIFADKGPAAFTDGDDPERLLALLALTTSSTFRYLVGIQMTFGSYEVGVIQRTPVPDISSQDRKVLANLGRTGWLLKRQLDTMSETSHAFLLPRTIAERLTVPDKASTERQLEEIRSKIDSLAYDLYGIAADEQGEVEILLRRQASKSSTLSDEDESNEVDDRSLKYSSTLDVGSWLVGVAFGRFDLRLATGTRAVPSDPEPFDPLPAQSPGMWPAGESRPVPPPDILVDDLGHADDIGAHVSAKAELAEVQLSEDLRRWLAREFFPLHIKMYSKSRRKAPIYWQLATPSSSYSVWLYVHAFSGDTMYRVQNDYIVPKLRHEVSRLEALEREVGEKTTAAQRRAIADQETFVGELRGFLDEVKRVAPLWGPDLDDGVIINFAPLWRLVPQHRPWQRELKATWDALCDGKYDWAHLAMRLWPGRVVPKCRTDRSLAIAHGLEDIFWAQGQDGKWAARSTPTRSIDQLIAERTSDAVKAALRNLLDAPATVRTRAGRRRSANGTANRGGL